MHCAGIPSLNPWPPAALSMGGCKEGTALPLLAIHGGEATPRKEVRELGAATLPCGIAYWPMRTRLGPRDWSAQLLVRVSTAVTACMRCAAMLFLFRRSFLFVTMLVMLKNY